MTRRAVLSAAAFGVMSAPGSGELAARPKPFQDDAARLKGPRIWLDMDQKELDDAYDQSVYAANMRQVLERYVVNSEAVRTRLGQPLRLAYGSTFIEMLDVYETERPNAPINIYIHGGAWRSGSAKTNGFFAELFVNAGAHVVVPDFGWVQDAGGSLIPMADQVRRSVAWVYRNARSFGGNPNRIFVSGFSSGGHLAGIVLTTDWQREFDLPADLVKGGMCCSGMSDLKPVRLSARRNYVNFTDETEDALSPVRHLDRLKAPLIVAYGTHETPEFQRQSRDFAAAVESLGKPVQLIAGAGYNHFEMIETLANPYGLLGRSVLEQMRLSQVWRC